jgi:hypothetical protein
VTKEELARPENWYQRMQAETEFIRATREYLKALYKALYNEELKD